MKILHTSDWHLGHTLYNYDRTEEQQAMLEQMVSIVEEQKPDVFLLCGDVYHTPQPSAAVQTMLSDGLVRIHEANPQMTIVMTAGNHDSGTKHEIFQTPWKALKVYAIGQLEKARMSILSKCQEKAGLLLFRMLMNVIFLKVSSSSCSTGWQIGIPRIFLW